MNPLPLSKGKIDCVPLEPCFGIIHHIINTISILKVSQFISEQISDYNILALGEIVANAPPP